MTTSSNALSNDALLGACLDSVSVKLIAAF
jgi:hypothetical protein